MTASDPALAHAKRVVTAYRAIWRWHFYAGLFCVPFIVVLAITGSIYLFKPQVEAWLERPFDHLALTGPPARVEAQVAAGLAAVPGGKLRSVEVRQDPADAARVTVGKGGDATLVYVHPQTLRVLKVLPEDRRLMEIDKTIHGELLMGERGSILVELAASWAIVMIVTGLYLWWPRQAQGLAGVLYPRLSRGSKLFWRDLHAVTGVWISSLALFLLITGMPWATVWGGGLKQVRALAGAAAARQDWTVSRKVEHAEHVAADAQAPPAMAGMDMAGMDMGGMDHTAMAPPASLDAMTAGVRALNLPSPVLIAPPAKAGSSWTARSDTPDRPRRVTLTLDPVTGAVLERDGFETKHPIDQVIGYGIAAHEGQLFGLANQLLGLMAALGLVTLAVSGVVLWWRRRPEGALGAPEPIGDARIALGVGVLIVVFGVLLPVLGVCLILIALVERLVLRRIPPLRAWLGLRRSAARP